MTDIAARRPCAPSSIGPTSTARTFRPQAKPAPNAVRGRSFASGLDIPVCSPTQPYGDTDRSTQALGPKSGALGTRVTVDHARRVPSRGQTGRRDQSRRHPGFYNASWASKVEEPCWASDSSPHSTIATVRDTPLPRASARLRCHRLIAAMRNTVRPSVPRPRRPGTLTSFAEDSHSCPPARRTRPSGRE